MSLHTYKLYLPSLHLVCHKCTNFQTTSYLLSNCWLLASATCFQTAGYLHGEAKSVHSGTGAVESKQDMIVRTLSITTALVADAEWCAVNSRSDNACMLFQILRQSLETKHVPSTSTPATDKEDTSITGNTTITTSITATAQQLPIKRDGGILKPTLPKANLSTTPNGIPIVVELFKKASAQPMFAESMHHFFKAYL